MMNDPLAWTGAIGGAVAAVGAVVAAIGAWRTEATARWQARVERLVPTRRAKRTSGTACGTSNSTTGGTTCPTDRGA
jgi:hypothetical protein